MKAKFHIYETTSEKIIYDVRTHRLQGLRFFSSVIIENPTKTAEILNNLLAKFLLKSGNY